MIWVIHSFIKEDTMLKLKVMLAFNITLARFNFGFRPSIENMFMLINALENKKHVQKLFRKFLNKPDVIISDFKKASTLRILLDGDTIANYRYRAILDTLLEKDFLLRYGSCDMLMNVIDRHQSQPVYRKSNSQVRSEYILGFGGDLKKILTFTRICYTHHTKNKINKQLLQGTIFSICSDLNFRIPDILEALLGENHAYLKHHINLEDRFIYLICRYGEPKDALLLSEKRPELNNTIRKYVKQYGKKKKLKAKPSWRM